MQKSKIIGYARVSTLTQNEDRQVTSLLAVGVPKENIFVDKFTGKSFDRPQYRKMLQKIDEDTVLFVKSIDRLGRNYMELCDQWRVLTKEKGADVVIIDMPILDTRKEKNLLGTFISDLVLALLSYVSETEFQTIHLRQAEGIAAAKARGVKFGRPPRPLPDNFENVYEQWETKKITTKSAAQICKMPVSTFRYKAKSYRDSLHSI